MSEQVAPIRVSRVGKREVVLPKDVSVKVENDRTVTIKGPKGELTRTFHTDVIVKNDKGTLTVVPNGRSRRFASYQGLTRALLNNMVHGVTVGYTVSLDLFGVGYRCVIDGQKLTLSLGLSHQIVHHLDSTVSAKVETIDDGGTKRPRLHLSSCNKEALGQDASRIRSYRPPEPYKGKGVRYTGERIREKAGKTGG